MLFQAVKQRLLLGYRGFIKTLFFDDYDLEGPENIIDWVDRGGDREAWNLTPFLKDLERLSNAPLDYLFLDYPFAYTHNEVSGYLDMLVSTKPNSDFIVDGSQSIDEIVDQIRQQLITLPL
ncbi:hypothetical protein [Alkalihalobacillus trypoxylicola]|uniref:Uncharacterized protein n=1 Tax=Alkalihalobacillus trypoxylicola TaxID=519424 RepID=A0A161QFQ7_9BACI|nr:hypothetical protein [Alkalihalobacillus trypoxylicola]KYG27719.1 hypothetical protein AZF04_11055 [Alkalihalobacillus trypoxylicola]